MSDMHGVWFSALPAQRKVSRASFIPHHTDTALVWLTT